MMNIEAVVASALVSAVVASLISGVFSAWTTRTQVRETRLGVAAELTRLNQERYIEAGRNTPGAAIELLDPSTVMRFYLAELDEMAKHRTTLKAEWTKAVAYKEGPKP